MFAHVNVSVFMRMSVPMYVCERVYVSVCVRV
jgi:hypothetical protein